jgi:pyridoxamine 5'-phosphate oxidase
MALSAIRRRYSAGGLHAPRLARDPIRQFLRWMRLAQGARQPEPNAMALATAARGGAPSVRMVLLKGVDARGFVFFTNYGSRKARELRANPRAALAFHWGAVERNVRVEGRVRRLPRPEVERYFRSRPRGHQLGAWASPQSRRLTSRGDLERRLRLVRGRYRGREVPVPPSWGGFRVIPQAVEFWKGRPDQLHDRLRYVKTGRRWRLERLAP